MGGQGGSEQGIKVFVKIKKKKMGGRGERGGVGLGRSGWMCDRRIEVFEKLHIKIPGGGRVGGGGGQGGCE